MTTNIRDITTPDGFMFFYDPKGRPAESLPGKPTREASPSWVAKATTTGEARHPVGPSFVIGCLMDVGKPGCADEFVPRFTLEQVEAMMVAEMTRARMIAGKVSVTISKTCVSIMGGRRGQVIIAAWSTEGLFGRPLLTSLEDASKRDPIVATHKATIEKFIKDGNYGLHQLS